MKSSEQSLQSFMDRVQPLRAPTSRLKVFEPEMRELFSNGYALTQIHQYLVEECKVDISFRAFKDWLQKNEIKLSELTR
jgi:hypothetical protein